MAFPSPDAPPQDVVFALAPFGDSVEIPRVLVQGIDEFVKRHTRLDGSADFSAGPVLAFLDVYRTAGARGAMAARVEHLLSRVRSRFCPVHSPAHGRPPRSPAS